MKKNYLKLCLALFLAISFSSQTLAQVKSYFGTTPDLKVSGKEFVDPNGRPVSLHGVMDTPNDYFNGARWRRDLSWPVYNDSRAPKYCREYFTKIFDAIKNPGGGTYCNLFRLHLDPAWTNDPNKQATAGGGENDISRFSADRLRTYLNSLYIPIAEDALGHGLYVIIRPPGVFPEDVKVGDAYNQYLLTVWDIVSQNAWVKAHPGQVMLELGNEPVRMNGNLADYFQPIVNKIRSNGFKGILLLPGTAYQADYRNYNTKGISDNNFAYAVHNYPGWYGGWDANQSEANFISTFEAQVPIDKKPIVITEVDWSPMKQGAGHWNETHTQYTEGNFGTWATGTTNSPAPNVAYKNTQNVGWGLRFKHLVDKHPNISWTLQGTTTYVDMDAYLNSGKVQPAFTDQMKAAGYADAGEACSLSCFYWYYEYACGDRVPMPKEGGGSGGGSTEAGAASEIIGNASYDASNKHYCFYTTYYSSFIFNDFNGKALIDCADFTMDCGTCTTGYRLDIQLKDSKGNIIKDGTNDYIIGTEEKGTRVTKENASKIYNMQAIFADYLKQYPGCTIGNIRINTAIDQEDANKKGLYYITINKMEMNISQVTARSAQRTSLSNIKLMRYADVQKHLVNDDAESGNKMGGWGGTISHESEIGTFKSHGYRLTNSKQNSWEAQICYENAYINGKQYYLKMNVKGSVAGKISAAFQKSDGYEGRGDFGEYNVTTGYTEWRVPCTVNGEGADRLLINYGGFPGTLYIDNVEIYTVEPSGTDITGTNIRLGSSVENGAEVFGSGLLGNVAADEYADLTGYKKMTIKGTGGSLRVLYNRPASGTTPELNPSLESGSAVIDLTQYPYFHLNSIKVGWGQTANVTDIILTGDNNADEFANYYITGAGNISKSATDALADTKATCIDITGMTNKFSQPLTSTNPNSIMIYDAKQEVKGYGEEENLMGSAFDARNLAKKDGDGNYSCWRTDLVYGYDFCSPINLSCVGGASLTNDTPAEWNTAVLPFAINVSSCGAEIYKFKSVSGTNVLLEPVTSGTIAANTPIIYIGKNPSQPIKILSDGAVDITKTPAGFNIQPMSGYDGWFTALSYEEKSVDATTFKDYDVYTLSEGKLTRATGSFIMKPFTACFLQAKQSSAPSTLALVLDNKYDLDNDGNITLEDVILLISHLNGSTQYQGKYDTAKASKLSVSDVNSIVNILLDR